MMTNTIPCKICDNKENNKDLKIKEVYFSGTRELFNFLECGHCGCLQLLDENIDLSGTYYDNSTYGSFQEIKQSKMKHKLITWRNKFAILGKIRGVPDIVGYLLNKRKPMPVAWRIIGDYSDIHSKILDVGCGIGGYLNDLHEIGFRNVSGIDPFIDEDIVPSNGVAIRKMYLTQVDELFDVICSHHSFEHIPDPLETLLAMKKCLNPGGVAIITIPAAEDLYREYQDSFYGIQTPQHFFLHSIRSMEILAERSGLLLEKIHRDATNISSWYKYSELFRRGMTNNEITKNIDSYFSTAELKKFDALERQCLAQNKGDNVTFIYRKGR